MQLYVSQLAGEVTPPVRRLKRFVKVTLAPGASREVRLRLSRNDLTYIGPAGKPVLTPGPLTVMVGPLKQTVTIH
jgi:beta-glucosidase